jgi:hypothetical protein
MIGLVGTLRGFFLAVGDDASAFFLDFRSVAARIIASFCDPVFTKTSERFARPHQRGGSLT